MQPNGSSYGDWLNWGVRGEKLFPISWCGVLGKIEESLRIFKKKIRFC